MIEDASGKDRNRSKYMVCDKYNIRIAGVFE